MCRVGTERFWTQAREHAAIISDTTFRWGHASLCLSKIQFFFFFSRYFASIFDIFS